MDIMEPASLLNKARKCLSLEKDAIEATAAALNSTFIDVVHAIKATMLASNKIIFSGVGKNAPICQKLVGTFNSTGTTSCFLNPTQALHGDLGLLAENDLAFLLSNSGETEELIQLLPSLKRMRCGTVAITAQPDSQLARETDHLLLYQVPQEACPLNLAPTASTTAVLALGDALAMVYLDIRGFTREDFARLHPAGSIGKTLLLRVDKIMRCGHRFAKAADTITVLEAIMAISQAKCGAITLVDAATDQATGIFTDGDFRRCALTGDNFIQQPVARFMTRTPMTIRSGSLAVEALKKFEKNKINALIVIDEAEHPIGLIDTQDLPKIKLL